jgi:hypothetical protein
VILSDERTTELAFSTGLVGTTTERLRITSDGSVGIGTNSPTNGNLQIGDSDTDFNIAIAGARTKFGYDSSNNSAVVQGGLTKGIIFCVNNSTFGSGEAGRFDASGNLLVGTTNASGSTAPDNSSDTNNAGLRLSGSLGFIGIGSNSQPTTYLNRIGSDGDIAIFRKSGTTIGSIGVVSSDNLYIQGNSTHVGFVFGSSAVAPFKNGAYTDNTVDLGTTSYRFQDIYLSGKTRFYENSANGSNYVSITAPASLGVDTTYTLHLDRDWETVTCSS